MEGYDNPIRRQVFSLPELIEQQVSDLIPKIADLWTPEEGESIQRIILTGCGDSYAACMAQKYTFETLTGIPTEVVPALELGRYYCKEQFGREKGNPLVIAVSNSGNVARVSEAVQRVRMHGSMTLGITGNRDSELGRHGEKILCTQIPPFESAPGTRSYLVSILALNLLAVRLGELRKDYTTVMAERYREDIRNQSRLLTELLPQMDRNCLEIANQWKDYPCYEYVGAGFDYAAAWFGQAKILEAVGQFVMHCNAEDWHHLNFFAREADKIGTVVVCNTANPALSRTKEMVGHAKKLGRALAIITDGGPGDFDSVRAAYIQVPNPVYPIHMPVTHFAPLCLLAGYLSAMKGETYGRGSEGPWEFSKGGRCVKDSKIVIRQ